MDAKMPTNEVRNLIGGASYRVRSMYLCGSVMRQRDLLRAAVHQSRAVFILASKFTHNAQAQDAMTILRTLAIKRFLVKCKAREGTGEGEAAAAAAAAGGVVLSRPRSSEINVAMYVQLVEEQSRGLLHSATSESLHRFDQAARRSTHIVCVNRMKLELLAKSCVCPGLTAFVWNLVASQAEMTGKLLPWQKEYAHGCEYEIYRVPLTDAFSGHLFSAVAKIVLEEANITVFAIEVAPLGAPPRVILNPGLWPIPSCTDFLVHAFVIATDKEEADVLSVVPGKGAPSVGAGLQGQSGWAADGANAAGGRKEGGGEGVASASASASAGSDIVRGLLGKPDSDAKDKAIKPKLSLSARMKKASEGELRRDAQLAQGVSTRMHLRKLQSMADISDPVEKKLADKISKRLNAERRERAPLGPPGECGDGGGSASSEGEGKASPAAPGPTTPKKNTFGNHSQYQPGSGAVRILRQPVPYGDGCVTNFATDLPGVTGHIIVAGPMGSMPYFLRPLRMKHYDVQPIVIICDQLPSLEEWAAVAHFEDVYFMRGMAHHMSDMDLAGVAVASRVVLVGRPPQPKSAAAAATAAPSADAVPELKTAEDGIVDEDEGMDGEVNISLDDDAHVIFAYRTLSARFPRLPIVCELLSASNLNLLSRSELQKHHNMFPDFAAGFVFEAALLDTLLCQAFYNADIITVMELLVSGADESFTEMWDTSTVGQMRPVDDSVLYDLAIPPMFANATYGKFADYLFDKGVVPLSLRRAVVDADESSEGGGHGSTRRGTGDSSQGIFKRARSELRRRGTNSSSGSSTCDAYSQESQLPYVFTNPPLDTLLRPNDSVMALAHKDVGRRDSTARLLIMVKFPGRGGGRGGRGGCGGRHARLRVVNLTACTNLVRGRGGGTGVWGRGGTLCN